MLTQSLGGMDWTATPRLWRMVTAKMDSSLLTCQGCPDATRSICELEQVGGHCRDRAGTRMCVPGLAVGGGAGPGCATRLPLHPLQGNSIKSVARQQHQVRCKTTASSPLQGNSIKSVARQQHQVRCTLGYSHLPYLLPSPRAPLPSSAWLASHWAVAQGRELGLSTNNPPSPVALAKCQPPAHHASTGNDLHQAPDSLAVLLHTYP